MVLASCQVVRLTNLQLHNGGLSCEGREGFDLSLDLYDDQQGGKGGIEGALISGARGEIASGL
jgi:hypothetical protein